MSRRARPSLLKSLLDFLHLKRYQYEVTFSLYMLTPTEKIIFNSFLFVFLSLLIVAVSFYLPHHVAVIARRAWWYYAGDSSSAAALSPSSVLLEESSGSWS